MSDETPYLRNWDEPGIAQKALSAIRQRIAHDSVTPDSGIRMCHAQGKSAVYLSKCGEFIIIHHPDGTIAREPLAQS